MGNPTLQDVCGLKDTEVCPLSDHVPSVTRNTTITANSSGGVYSELRYRAWGEYRYIEGDTPTSLQYTGQRSESSLGIYFYNARWYDARLSRFLQADSIIPDPYDSQAWDRYAYARNAPTRYIDPTGHGYCEHTEFALAEDCAGWNSRIEIEIAVIDQYRDPLHSDEDYGYGTFGDHRDKHPFEPHKDKDRWHAAIDTAGDSKYLDEDVYPVLPGNVVYVGWEDTSLGNFIVVEHDVLGEKLYSVYGHLGTERRTGVDVSTGDSVTQNTPIGSVGTSGKVDTHLHFEIRYATNVNLNESENMLRGKDYWAFDSTWYSKFFDLGKIYGYYDNRRAGDPPLP
jgi:RHS repeat-associated protein